ncbi:MAG: hypoxanthine phosphoribosyltransferase [Oscillospiraceae bacterium]|nr:hypoxanthine phosphoribosyltransferase [Oscillospiraceae bacterium]
MMSDIQEILLTEEQISARIKELGAQITEDYRGKELVLIGILKGVVPFYAAMAQAIDLQLQQDFMSVSSYGAGTVSSGKLIIRKDIDIDIEGKDVLILEDILDSGRTLRGVVQMFEARRPASVKICTLLDKPAGRVENVAAAYSGFVVPDAFVVGYGLDYAGYYRNLPFVGVLKPSVYQD